MGEQVALGIDIGGTNVKVAFVDTEGRVLAEGSTPTAPERGPELFCAEVSEFVKNLATRHEVVWSDVIGAGVGIAGFLDVPKGWVEESVNLHWKDVYISEMMGQHLGKPVYLDNDANVAALGEVWLGAGKNAQTAVCVTLGTGVGGGVVIDGHIHRGASTMAGEIGHIHIKNDGMICNCGRPGCLETLASATAIAREGKLAGLVSPSGGELTAKDVFVLAAEGNSVAQGVIDEMARWLGIGLSIAANLLNPDVIVIAGGVVNAGNQLMEPVRKSFETFALNRSAQACQVVPAILGDQAGVLGACRLVLLEHS